VEQKTKILSFFPFQKDFKFTAIAPSLSTQQNHVLEREKQTRGDRDTPHPLYLCSKHFKLERIKAASDWIENWEWKEGQLSFAITLL
jgi:hypothetical protein